MTILALAPVTGQPIIEAELTALDRQYAVESSPYSSEWHTDEPTPLAALVEPDDDERFEPSDEWRHSLACEGWH